MKSLLHAAYHIIFIAGITLTAGVRYFDSQSRVFKGFLQMLVSTVCNRNIDVIFYFVRRCIKPRRNPVLNAWHAGTYKPGDKITFKSCRAASNEDLDASCKRQLDYHPSSFRRAMRTENAQTSVNRTRIAPALQRFTWNKSSFITFPSARTENQEVRTVRTNGQQ